MPDATAVYACDMLSTGFMGIEHAYLQFGETVAIFAQGPVGLSATIGAHLMGAGQVIAVESRPERPALARQFGADVIVDVTEGDPVEQIMDLTGGVGVDPAVEAFGFPQTFEACVKVTKAGGRVSNIGYHGENPNPLQLPLDAFGLGMNDKAIHTGLCPGGSERMTRLLRLLQFRAPTYVRNVIDRERLLAVLGEGGGRQLAVIHAPAGYGKTTLAVQCSAPCRTTAPPPRGLACTGMTTIPPGSGCTCSRRFAGACRRPTRCSPVCGNCWNRASRTPRPTCCPRCWIRSPGTTAASC